MAFSVLSSDEITVVFGLDWILILLVFVTLMFYFNRLIGSLLTFAAKVLLWNQFKISIHFQSFKVSLLAGRIFVKNFSIVTKDFTLCILEGNLTWRYWFLNVRDSEYGLNNYKDSAEESTTNAKRGIQNEKLPSRFLIQIDGLEVFVYNRTYAYDYVLEQMKKQATDDNEYVSINTGGSNLEETFTSGLKRRIRKMSMNNYNDSEKSADSSLHDHKLNQESQEASDDSSSFFGLMSFLPIEFSVHKCGIVIGNENTSSIVVSSFDRALGSFDIGSAANPILDYYRHNIKLQLKNLHIQLKPNVNYREPISSSYLNSNNFNIHEEYIKKRKQRRFRRYKNLWKEFVNVLQKVLPRYKDTQINGESQRLSMDNDWRGLPQYLDDEDDHLLNDYNNLKNELSQEYAIYRTIVDADKCDVLYFYDIPGKVHSSNSIVPPTVGPNVGNGGEAPKTGVEIELCESTIYYGPWADRQRISLYKYFFPQANNYVDCKPTEKLSVGDTRIYTNFDFSVEFVDDKSIIRVPMREFSKDLFNSLNKSKSSSAENKLDLDSKRKRAKETKDSTKKPFAWIELKLFKHSLVSANTEYERSEQGSNVDLEVLIKSPELRSSINHDIFYRAKDHFLKVGINFPLKWKDITIWNVYNKSNHGDLFLLREHVSLLTDLLNDFATPEASLQSNPSEMINSYNSFRPYEYKIHWNIMDGIRLFLNVNSQNIINNPLDFNDNTYISFQTNEIDIYLLVPMHNVYQKCNSIDFSVESKRLSLILETPSWNTLNTFLKNKELARGTDFKVEGSYTYHSSIEVNLVDQILINCFISNTTFQSYGFLIKYIMEIRENYFGENIHFQTLEEYTDKKQSAQDDSDKSATKSTKASSLSNHSSSDVEQEKPEFNHEPTFQSRLRNKAREPKQMRRIENELDVLFSFCVDNGCLVLPCHMYDSNTFIAARLPNFDIDIRFTNYYMDLQCDISPLKITYVENTPEAIYNVVYDTEMNTNPDMFINGLSIHGHRIFGLPPLEPTYICKWDISAGAIAVNSNGQFLSLLFAVLLNLAYTFQDLENALVVEIPDLNDVTIFSFKCPSISVKVSDRVSHTELIALLEPVSLKLNDLSNNRYTSRMDLKIKNITVKVKNKQTSAMLAYLTTSVYITNFCKKKNFTEHHTLQQAHIKKHDGPSHRLPFLLDEDLRDDYYNKNYGKIIASLSLPDMAPPLTSQTVDIVFERLPISKEYGRSDLFDEETISDRLSSTSSLIDADSDNNGKSLLEFLPSKNLETDKQKFQAHKFTFGENDKFMVEDDSEITPKFDMRDEKYEYDNFIVNLSSIDIFASSKSMASLCDIVSGIVEWTPHTVLDVLQIHVLQNLISIDNEFNFVKNMRIISPLINFHYGDFVEGVSGKAFESVILSDDDKLANAINTIFEGGYFKLNLLSPSLAISIKKASEALSDSSEDILALHLPSIDLEIYKNSVGNNSQCSLAFKLTVDDLEAWYDEKEKLISSVNLDEIDFHVFAENVEWLAGFLQQNIDALIPLTSRITSAIEKSKGNTIELLYKLSIASEKYNIFHDSSVLTKPTHIIRNSEVKHIRSYDSWRILIRLRHILSNLPAEWDRDTFGTLETNDWEDHEKAFNDVLRVFSKWRSWEFSDIKRNYVFRSTFRKLFSEAQHSIKSAGVNLTLAKIGIRLGFLQGLQDHIILENIEGETFINNDLLENSSDIKFALNVSLIETKFSPALFVLVKAVNLFNYKDSSDETSQQTPDKSSLSKKLKVHATLSVNNFDTNLRIDKTSYEANFSDMISSTLLSFSDGDIMANNITEVKLGAASLLAGGVVLLNQQFKNYESTLCHTGSILEGLNIFSAKVMDVQLSATNGSCEYIRFLENLCRSEIDHITSLMKECQASESPREYDEKETLQQTSLNLMQSLRIKLKMEMINFLCDFEILSPILSNSFASNVALEGSYLNGLIYSDLRANKLKLDLIYNSYGRKYLARCDQSSASLTIKGQLHHSKPFLQFDFNFGCLELYIPQILRSIDDVLGSRSQITGDVEEYLDYVKKIQLKFINYGEISNEGKRFGTKEDANSLLEKLIFKASFSNDSFKLISGVDDARLELVFYDTTTFFGNFVAADGNKIDKTPLYGEVILPKIEFSVFDYIIPKDLSTITSSCVMMRLGNSTDLNNGKRIIEITSDFFRFSLCPQSLVKILEIVARIQSVKVKYNNSSPVPSTSPKSDTSLLDFLDNFAIHILSYNFCFGWIFGSGERLGDLSGIVIGCDRVYIISEKSFGKLTIVDAYWSITHGNASSDFYRSYSTKHKASLSNVQLMYSIAKSSKGKRHLNIKVTGELLDVRLLSKYIIGSDRFIKSIATTQKLKEELVPEIDVAKPSHDMEESGYMESLSSLFTSVNCIVRFAGAYIKIDQTGSERSSLELRSPAVEISLGYKKVIGILEHLVRCEITFFASDNNLFSGCVPVILELWHGIQTIMKEEASRTALKNDATSKHKQEVEPNQAAALKEASSPLDLALLLKNVDFNGLVNIQAQRLSLSCAPNAKIKAVVGTRHIKLQLNTVEAENKILTGSLLINDLTAKLQHVYSRENSGSISVGNVVLNAVLQQQDKNIKIFTSAEVSKVKTFINMNQLQDLNIFKDIWLPKSKKTKDVFPQFPSLEIPDISVSDSNNIGKSDIIPKSKTFAERFQQVSTTNAFPWNVNFAVSDVELVVDLGQSLGVASLLLDKFWIVQAKNSHWEQNLTLGVDALVLKCEGRLTADIVLRNLRLNSVIMWAHQGAIYEIPLVFISSGIDAFEIIIGFDYHTFFVSNFEKFYLSLFNQRTEDQTNFDRLFGTASLRLIHIYSTCLAASSFMDIINAFLRIRADNRSSYKEVLRDAGNLSYKESSKKDFSILETFTNLKTEVGVSVDSFLLHVYPSSLMDSDVLVIHSGRLSAKYIREFFSNELHSNLRLQWNNLDVALSKIKHRFHDSTVSSLNLDRFIKHSLLARGGTLLTLPSISIAMQTWQLKKEKVIRYKYNSSFGGTVDIRWNLGSVNFIRAMYDSHEKALSSRIAKNKIFHDVAKDDALKKTEERLESLKIKEKFEHAEQDTEYSYVAVEIPVIDPPQLKELGDVTPPLEWFGLHRKNFPALTHHFIILPLEQFVINIEKQYNSVLGKA